MVALLAFLNAAWAAELSGVVRERGTRDPLRQAEVLLPDGTTLAVDGGGRFRTTLPDGTWVVTVRAPGYLDGVWEVVLPPDVELVAFLEPAPPTPEIVVESRRDEPQVAALTLDREQVERIPGTHGDAFRLVQALPGVTLTREYAPGAGSLSLRGALPGESRIYLDGMELPYLFHFQDYASVVPSRLLDELQVLPSTFNASWGDAVGGVVAATSRPPEVEAAHGGVNLSLVMGGAWVAAPLGPSASTSASARRSYADWLGSDSDQYTVWPVFWDYLGRYERLWADRHVVSLTLLGAGDGYGRLAREVDEQSPFTVEDNPEFTSKRQFHGLSLRSRSSYERARLDTLAAVVADSWHTAVALDSASRRDLYGQVRLDGVVQLLDPLYLAVGGDVKLVDLALHAGVERAWLELEREAPLLARGVDVDEGLRRAVGGVYLEPRWTVGPLRLQPGLRVNADSASRTLAVDPRLTARLELPQDLRLRAAVGLYSQAPSLDALSTAIGDPDLDMTLSQQAAVGGDLALAGRLEVGLDAWAKWLQHTVETTAGEAPRAVDGSAWGTELVLRYRLREKVFLSAFGTLGRSWRDGHPADHDQPYAAGLAGAWTLGGGWGVGLRWRYAAGLPLTPVASSIYDGDIDDYLPVPGPRNSERMPDYQKVDLRLDKTITFRRWTVSGYAELWWVPGDASALYPVYAFDYSQRTLVGGPSFVPLVGGSAEF